MTGQVAITVNGTPGQSRWSGPGADVAAIPIALTFRQVEGGLASAVELRDADGLTSIPCIGARTMSQGVQHLFQAALALSDEEQLQLLTALGAAVDERGLRPVDDVWPAEIQRRSAEYDAGGIEPIPWAEVKRRARRELPDRG